MNACVSHRRSHTHHPQHHLHAEHSRPWSCRKNYFNQLGAYPRTHTHTHYTQHIRERKKWWELIRNGARRNKFSLGYFVHATMGQSGEETNVDTWWTISNESPGCCRVFGFFCFLSSFNFSRRMAFHGYSLFLSLSLFLINLFLRQLYVWWDDGCGIWVFHAYACPRTHIVPSFAEHACTQNETATLSLFKRTQSPHSFALLPPSLATT